VNITLIFDPDLDNHINDDKGKNLIPTDVTQYYRYGTPDCSQFHGTSSCVPVAALSEISLSYSHRLVLSYIYII